jgi:predicted O-methyltransferase YrrM
MKREGTTMSARTIQVDDRLHAYLLAASLREPASLKALRDETHALPQRNMQISPEQGQFMQLLLELMGARRVIEIGTFTGYSAMAMALALPADGQIVTCDVSEDFTSIARRHWKSAGVAGKIDLRLAPALETLDGLLRAGAAGTFDAAFIDADKSSYGAYYERTVSLLRPGGLCMIDNVLWDGRVADLAVTDADTVAIRELNGKIHGDARVTVSMVPIGDGLTLARKRA